MSQCHVCEAAEHASDESLASLVRRQAVMLERARAKLDTFGLARAEARVRELEETLTRVQLAQPQRTAVEVCRELARTDPRDMESLRCQWCGEPTLRDDYVKHRPDCTFIQAQIVAERAGKRDTQQVIDRWRTA